MKTTETPRWKRTEVEPREVYLESTFKVIPATLVAVYSCPGREDKLEVQVNRWFPAHHSGKYRHREVHYSRRSCAEAVLRELNTSIKNAQNEFDAAESKADALRFELEEAKWNTEQRRRGLQELEVQRPLLLKELEIEGDGVKDA